MNKKLIIGLMVVSLSVNSWAKNGGGGSFGKNDDKVSKFPAKKLRNVKNEIPGLQSGEYIYINAKVVVRTRNYFWIASWIDGYAELKITNSHGREHKVNRLSLLQVEAVKYILHGNISNAGGRKYTSDIQFHWGLDSLYDALIYGRYLPRYPVTFNNGHTVDTLGYNQNRYTVPNGYNIIPGHYKSKNNASSLRISLVNPNAEVVTFFNVKLSDNLGFGSTLTNDWSSGGVSIPRQEVSSF
jgi:hypothetical protein